jgi:hypothetical protein
MNGLKGGVDLNLAEVIGTSRLKNTIELYYACLLGKYIKNRNDRLSLSGVDLSEFKDTIDCSIYYDFFRYSLENGYITDLGFDLPVLEEDGVENLSKFLFMGSFDSVKPYFYNIDGYKHYIDLNDVGGNSVNLKLFKVNIEESSVIDLTAYLHVCSLYDHKPYELYPRLSATLRSTAMGVSSLYYLSRSPITKGILKFKTYSTADENNLGYNTWYFLGKEQGLLDEEGYTLTEKLKRLDKDEYRVGNVVFLYERSSTSKSRREIKIVNCIIAVIRDIRGYDITLERVPFHHTRVARRKMFEGYSRSVQEFYKYSDFEPVTLKETYNLTSLGVDYLMSNDLNEFESYFITPVVNSKDVVMWVEQNGIEFEHAMSLADAVFWVLKDWGIEFNEELYIKTYYKNGETPAYYKNLIEDYI